MFRVQRVAKPAPSMLYSRSVNLQLPRSIMPLAQVPGETRLGAGKTILQKGTADTVSQPLLSRSIEPFEDGRRMFVSKRTAVAKSSENLRESSRSEETEDRTIPMGDC